MQDDPDSIRDLNSRKAELSGPDDKFVIVDMKVGLKFKYPRSIYVDDLEIPFDPEFVQASFAMFRQTYETDRDFINGEFIAQMEMLDVKIDQLDFCLEEDADL